MIHIDPTIKIDGPLTSGTYSVAIVSAEEKLTRAGDGKILKLWLEVINHPRTGYRFPVNILTEHPSERAMYYSRKLLVGLLEAVGIDTSQRVELDPSSLIGHVVEAVVIVKNCGPEYGMRNDVARFLKADINDVPEGTGTSESLARIPF